MVGMPPGTSVEPALQMPEDALSAGLPLLERDACILGFNERVLHWVAREDVPLLERLRYLSIVSSNLDEFFEVRSLPHIAALRQRRDNAAGACTGKALLAKAQQMVARQYALFNQELVPALRARGIRIVSHKERTAAQRAWVYKYFVREVKPLLVPVALDPAHPFP